MEGDEVEIKVAHAHSLLGTVTSHPRKTWNRLWTRCMPHADTQIKPPKGTPTR
jgi:hypothetical protein